MEGNAGARDTASANASSAFAFSASRRWALVEPRVLERDRGVAGDHLEEAHVVGVERADAELREHDRAGDASAVAERDDGDRLVDLARAWNRAREVAAKRVEDEQRPSGCDAAADDPRPDTRSQRVCEVRGPAASAIPHDGMITANSSPPIRQTTSDARTASRMTVASPRRSPSPAPWP